MSHAEQLAFFDLLVSANVDLVRGGSVLEIGSYDVNGSMRRSFGDVSRFVGVDLVDGPGVDVVAFGHEVDPGGPLFDLVVSGECFEHDQHWRQTLANMVRLTRPGGITAFTCASRGRPEHGTRRTDAAESPGSQFVGLDYYRNLVAADFQDLPLDAWFVTHRFWRNDAHSDLFFAGVRVGDADGPNGCLPSDDRVAALEHLMSIPQRAVRMPLRAAGRILKDEDRFQSFAVAYWGFARRVLGENGFMGRARRSLGC